MGNNSLDSFLEHVHIDSRLQRRAREAVTYLTLLTYGAGATACGNGPTGVDPPPPPPVGAPTISITATPDNGMAPLNSNVCFTVTAGKNGTIKDAWGDFNGNGRRDDPDETLSAGETCKQQTYTSTSTLTGLVTGGDDQKGNPNPKTITVTQPPQTFQYLVAAKDGRTTQPIGGATITSPDVAGINAVTGIDGKVTITSTTDLKGKKIRFSAPGYAEFDTYIANSPDGNGTSYLIGTDINPATGKRRIDSFNDVGRTTIDGLDWLTIRWAPNSNPRYGIYPEGLDNDTKGFATDVMKNDMELGAPGALKNATNPEILTAPIDSIGAITVEHGDINGTRYYLVDNQIVGIRVLLRNGIFRGAASHEIAGHGSGQKGHQPNNVLSVMSAQARDGFEPVDIENGGYLYRRTYASAKLDRDTGERPLIVSSSGLSSNLVSAYNQSALNDQVRDRLKIIEIRDKPDGTLETVILKDPTSSASLMQSNINAARVLKANNQNNYKSIHNNNRRH